MNDMTSVVMQEKYYNYCTFTINLMIQIFIKPFQVMLIVWNCAQTIFSAVHPSSSESPWLLILVLDVNFLMTED